MDKKGFSMMELIVAMATASIVGMTGYLIFSSANWSYKTQEDVAEAQQNLRVAMDQIAKDIRVAGFGLPDSPVSLTFDTQTFSAPITASTSTTGPDRITILGIGYEAGVLGKGVTTVDTECNGNGDSYICLCTDNDTTSNGRCPIDYEKADSFFSKNDPYPYQPTRRYISLNGITFLELSSTASDHLKDVGAGHDVHHKMKLANPVSLDREFLDGTPVYIIQAVQYTIATDLTGCSIANPCLASADFTMLRGGGSPGARQVLAENIEDIQFAYGIDVNRNGQIDDKDGDGVYEDTDFRFSETTANDIISDPLSIIAARINIVARARYQDSKAMSGFKRPALEDRAEGTTDGYRRRVLTKVVRLRNPRSGS